MSINKINKLLNCYLISSNLIKFINKIILSRKYLILRLSNIILDKLNLVKINLKYFQILEIIPVNKVIKMLNKI